MKNEIIKIEDHDGQQLVNARDLHEFLNVQSKFADWIKNRINKFDFIENQDYISVSKNLENGGKSIDYALTIDMAKELSMVENSDKGREARKYFIMVEKKFKENQVSLNNIGRKELAKMIIEAEEEIEQQRKQLEEKDKKIEKMQMRSDLVERAILSSDLINIGQATKLLQLPFGRNTMFRLLRNKNIIFGKDNEPKQEYINRGYFKIKQIIVKINENTTKIQLQTLVTQKGLMFLYKLFTNNDVQPKLAIVE